MNASSRLALLLCVSTAMPAHAQLFGARPGYANATLKQEHDRQRMQALQRQAAREQAAKTASEQAAAAAAKK